MPDEALAHRQQNSKWRTPDLQGAAMDGDSQKRGETTFRRKKFFFSLPFLCPQRKGRYAEKRSSPMSFGGNGGFQWLLVCLGNPGREYEGTRHNIGFLLADELERREGVKINKLRYRALTGEVRLAGQRVLVIKPQTYMNLSGEAVKLAGGFYKIPPDHVLVVSDDVALPLGKLRIRAGGSAGGHNGLKNIIAHLGTDQFPRIRVGVGAPEHPEDGMIDWVIGKFTQAEKKVVDEAVSRALDAALCLMEKGVGEAQNRYN